MPTRYSDEHHARDWPYPSELTAFLQHLGVNLADEWDARARIGVFLMTRIARRMPAELRLALMANGLLDARDQRTRTRPGKWA